MLFPSRKNQLLSDQRQSILPIFSLQSKKSSLKTLLSRHKLLLRLLKFTDQWQQLLMLINHQTRLAKSQNHSSTYLNQIESGKILKMSTPNWVLQTWLIHQNPRNTLKILQSNSLISMLWIPYRYQWIKFAKLSLSSLNWQILITLNH